MEFRVIDYKYLLWEGDMSYKDLDIYNLALRLFFEVHSLSLKLPRHELYELAPDQKIC